MGMGHPRSGTVGWLRTWQGQLGPEGRVALEGEAGNLVVAGDTQIECFGDHQLGPEVEVVADVPQAVGHADRLQNSSGLGPEGVPMAVV